MKDIATIVWVVIASAVLVVLLAWWAAHENKEPELILDESGSVKPFSGPFLDEDKATRNMNPIAKTNDNNPVAVFTTSAGIIEIELFADLMPITVGNFTTLAKDGFYDGTKFHRVIQGFMIQGGDPNSKSDDPTTYGTGGPGYTIQDEFVTNDLLTNMTGTIAMANTGAENSGGSQFFINTADNTFLDFNQEPLTSRHPVFGRVISGMDVVNEIEQVSTGQADVPLEPIVIESVTINE